MSDQRPILDYAGDRRTRLQPIAIARFIVIGAGIALPYASRLPGAFVRGPHWFLSYLQEGLGAFVFVACFQAINWGFIVLASLAYRSITAVVVAAIIGFASPAYHHARLDLSADAQAAVALALIPLFSLPYCCVGCLIGFAVDRLIRWKWPSHPLPT